MKRAVYLPPVTKYMLERYEPAANEDNGLWTSVKRWVEKIKLSSDVGVVWFSLVINGCNYVFDFWRVCIGFDHGGAC